MPILESLNEVIIKPRTIRLKISGYQQRSEMIKSLALSGYKTWQEDNESEKEFSHDSTDYFVCFEVDESEIS